MPLLPWGKTYFDPNLALYAGTQTNTFMSTNLATIKIVNLPAQTDQKSAAGDTLIRWRTPLIQDFQEPRRARIVQYLDMTMRGDGFIEQTWLWDYLTFLQLNYLLYTVCAFTLAGTVGNPGYTAPVTTYGPTQDITWSYALNATLIRPLLGRDMQMAPGGYSNVKFHFIAGTPAAA